ncbi:MAG: hypothetical protein ACR2HF_14970 [Methylococcaceae bacterium]
MIPRSYYSRLTPGLLKRLMIVGSLIALIAFPACTPYRDQPVSAFQLPIGAQSIRVFDTTLLAELDVGVQAAYAVYGFDIRAAGLLPVRCRIDHKGRTPLTLHPQQTFLIDRQRRAWPLLTTEQVRNRIASAPLGVAARQAAYVRLWGAAHTSAGGLAFGLWPDSSERDATRGLLTRVKDHKYAVHSGRLADAYLLFPDRDDIRDAVSLRLGLDMEGSSRAVNIPITIQ